MKITVERDTLLEAVSNVSRAVSAKSNISALEGILMKARDGSLFLCAYDLELGISTSISAAVEIPGELVLNAKLFSEMIRRMPSQKILIESDEKLLTKVQCGVIQFDILGIPATEFPELPNVNDSEQVEIPQNVLKSMIDQTLFAISSDESKPVHTGSLFEIREGSLRIVSVDGFRLAIRTEPIGCEKELRFIVPGKTLSDVSKLLADEEEPAQINLSRKHVVMGIGGYHVTSRLLEGDFLDYQKAIPTDQVLDVTVNTRRFIECVERMSLLINDRLKSPLTLQFDEDRIKLNCSTSIGKSCDELECKAAGEKLKMGFNNKYLLDALKASGCDEVRLKINGALAPLRILPPQGENFLFLILPVRLKNE